MTDTPLGAPHDELSSPFEIFEPATWRAPVVFNSPHSGSVYPQAFLAASRIDRAALGRSEDSFMDEMIAGLPGRGFPAVRVNFPRSYVDVNREPYELDPRMFTGRLPGFANTRSMRVAGGSRWDPPGISSRSTRKCPMAGASSFRPEPGTT